MRAKRHRHPGALKTRAGIAHIGVWLALAGGFFPATAAEVSRTKNAMTPIPIAIFGTDDRSALPERYRSLHGQIGVLFNVHSRTVCTAFCVGDDMVATAAHCLYRTVGETSPRLADFWFARNYDVVRDYARVAGRIAGATAQNVMAGSQKLSVRPPIDATRDWALIRLERPLCPNGGLQTQAMATDEILREAAVGQVFQVSYHRDYTQWRLAYSKPCGVKRDFDVVDWQTIKQDFASAEQLLLHTCDTGGASSGSPLFVDTPDGPRVIGINVGTYVQSKTLMQEGEVVQRLQADTVANTGVNISAFADKIEPFRRAQILTSSKQVKALQRGLKTLKLYDGVIDGLYTLSLKTAIETYELQNLVPVTGLATAALLKRLGVPSLEPPTAAIGKRAAIAR